MRIVLVALLLVLSATVHQAQAPAAGRGGGQPVGAIQPVKPGLWLVPGGGSNSLVRVTSEGVILVDTKMPGEANYDALVAQIRTVTDQPVRQVVVTHHHADHTGNDDRFIASGATVVGHEQLAANLKTYAFRPLPAAPTATYTDRYSIRLGGAEVQVLHLGRAHTGGDSVVYFPDLGVVATSDAVVTGAPGPLIDYEGGGSALEWLRVLDAMLRLDFDTAIPGAGATMTRVDVEAFRGKLGTVIDRAAELVRKGTPPDRLLSQIRTDDIGWPLRVPQVNALVAELTAAASR